MPEQIIELSEALEFYTNILDIHNNPTHTINEKIPKLRTQLDLIYKILVKQEKENFPDLFSRMNFIERKYNLDGSLNYKLNSLRITANKILHENFSPNNDDYFIFISAVIELIIKFSNVKPENELLEIYNNYKPLKISSKKTSLPDKIYSIYAYVIKNSGEQIKDDKKFIDLFCKNLDSENYFNVRIWYSLLNKFTYYSALLCSVKSTVLIKNIKLFDAEKQFYSSSNDTFIILQPNFLLSATDLAQSYIKQTPSHLVFFLNKLTPSDDSVNLLKGLIINKLLDILLTKNNYNVDDIIIDFIKDEPLTLFSYDNETFVQILNEIKSIHLKKLIDFTRSYSKYNFQIEPTFYSNKYGLYGRMDFLLQDKFNNFKKSVYELKTGNPPNNNLWRNEIVQTSIYHLLLKSVYGENNNYNANVIYSAAELNNYIRNVSPSVYDIQEISYLRNIIVKTIFDIAYNNIDIFQQLISNYSIFEFAPSYIKIKYDFLVNLYNNLRDYEKAFYTETISFILREQINNAIGSDNVYENSSGFSSLWLDDIQTKKDNYNIITDLSLQDFDEKNDILTFKINIPQVFNFRDNDIVLLYPQQNSIYPLNSQLIKATIRSIDEKQLKLELKNKLFKSKDFAKESLWCIEPDYMDFNTYSNIASLTTFLSSDVETKELLFGLKKPETENFNYTYDNELDEHQNKIVQSALQAKNYYLIQGPPGTGKTSTILTKIIQNLFTQSNKRIFIVAFTNRAVNEICQKLSIKNIPYLHISSAVSSDIINNIYNIAANKNTVIDIQREFLKHKIFVSTVSSFKSSYKKFSISSTDILVVDEASQLLEAELLGILSQFKKFILIGDQNQLPTVTVQKDKTCVVENKLLKQIGITDFRISTFERLYENAKRKNWTHCFNMLTTQYRMNDLICSLIQPFYQYQLKSNSQIQKQKHPNYSSNPKNELQKILNTHRLIFIPSKLSNSSRSNDHEAEIVKKLILAYYEMIGDKFDNSTIGVITPWRAQISNIKSRINSLKIKDLVTVDTIERFQGSEKKIIIISTCIKTTNQIKNIQNLNSTNTIDRKLNVALSRAQEQLIILGNKELLLKNKFYNYLINEILSRGIILSNNFIN